MKCQHDVENCIFIDKEHDEESCFNGIWEKTRICQECGYSEPASSYSMAKDDKGWFIPPVFKPKNCPKCKTEKSLV